MPPAQPGEAKTNAPIIKDDTAYLFLDDRSSTATGGESEHVNRATETSTAAHSSDPIPLQMDEEGKRFRCVAVRPSTAVIPMLQSLLSPFVMGLTKAARTVSIFLWLALSVAFLTKLISKIDCITNILHSCSYFSPWVNPSDDRPHFQCTSLSATPCNTSVVYPSQSKC